MRPKPDKLDKKHPDVARDAMEDIRELTGDARPIRNEIKYSQANRDRALGEADRTGRHFDGDSGQFDDSGTDDNLATDSIDDTPTDTDVK